MPTKEKKEGKKQQEKLMRQLFKEALADPHTRIEYIRKKDRSKQGVMITCKDPANENAVLVGFSMCRLAYDKFDKIERIKEKDFGKWIAFNRAMKYSDLKNVLVHFVSIEYKKPTVVYIPETVNEKMDAFIQNAYKYYKDATFPEWVTKTYPKQEDDIDEKDE